MAFIDDIIDSIKTVADANGTPEVKANLGTDGLVWNKDPDNVSKDQSLILFLTGLANAIEARTINRYPPFNGSLNKIIKAFISPNTIIFNNTNGILADDSFGIIGSKYNNGGKTVLSVSGDSVTVKQKVSTESSVNIPINIGPPDENINIEQTINRVQANIGDKLPSEATRTEKGLIKRAVHVDQTGITGDRAAEKLDEIIYALQYTTGGLPTFIMSTT
jgi:hypothetical protein